MSYKTHSEKLNAGVGKLRAGKMRIFSAKVRQFGIAAFILTVPLFFSRGRAEEPELSGKAAESEVFVDVKLKGAEQLDEILALKKRVAELEALERSLRKEKSNLTAERDLLRQELFDAINQVESQNADLRRLELGVAGLLADGVMPKATVREARLVEAIGEIIKRGQDLAVLSAEFCTEVDAMVKSLPAGNLEGVRLRLKIDEVLSASRKFSAVSKWDLEASPVSKCRVLAVNHELNFVVLPVGYTHGVFNGLILYVPGKTAGSAPVKLRVFATRSNTAAAQVADGDIRTLSPGSEAVTDLQQTNK